MTEVTLTESCPETVNISAEDGDTLVVAAPAMGPEATPRELLSEEDGSIRQLGESKRFADVGNTEEPDLLVAPSLYEWYTDADAANGLTEVLDSTTTVTASVAPHELDWLLCSADSPLEESHLAAFDRIVELQYDPTDQAEGGAVEAAVDATVSLLNADPDQKDVRADLAGFAYEHEYDHETLADVASEGDNGVYGPTLTPGVAAYLSTANRRGDASALPPEEVTFENSDDGLVGSLRDAGRDITEVATGSLGVSSTNAALAALLGGSAGAAAPAAGLAAVGFAGWAVARDSGGDDTAPALFDLLQQGRVPPPTRARIEAEAGLQPGTVELLGDLATPSSLRQLHQILDDTPEVIEEIEAAIDASDADELSGLLEDLADRTSEVGSLYDKQMAAAAKSLDAVAEELQSDEAALLGPVVDRSDIDPDEIPWVEVVDDESDEADVIEDGDSDTDERAEANADDTAIRTTTRREVATGEVERPETIQKVVGACLDNSVVVLRGGHGTGKTTAAYRAARALEDRGYTVRVPGFDASAATVEHRLRQDAGDDPVALVVSYEREMAGESLAGEFGTIQSWIEAGLVDTVLVECREEFYEQFEDETGFSVQPPENVLLDLTRFDSRVATEAVARWVLKTLGRVGELAEPYATESVDEESFRETFVEILDLSRGNSEIAKVAAKFAFAAEYSLEGINSHDDLIREDIEHLIETLGGSTDEPLEELFSYLGIARELRTRDLHGLRAFERKDLREVADSLSGYLNLEVRRALDESESNNWLADRETDVENLRWRLSPSIYTDVTFRRTIDVTADSTTVFESKYEDLRHLSLEGETAPRLHRNVAANFRVAHEAARQREGRDAAELDDGERNAPESFSVSAERIVAQAEEFLNQLDGDCDPGEFVGSIANLSAGLVPVSPSVFDDNDRIFAGAASEADSIEIEREVFLQNILGHQLAAATGDGSRRSTLATVSDEFAADVSEKDGYDPRKFLLNVYSMAISKLAESGSPGEVREWIEWVMERADRAATDGSHDLPPGHFLENVYSMAISKLAGKFSLGEVSEWVAWVVEEADRAATDASYDDDPDEFLENVYSMAISNLAGKFSPGEVCEWVEWISEQADRAATDGSHDAPPGEFLSNVYSMAIKHLAESASPKEASEWVDEIYEEIVRVASEGSHNLDGGSFVGRCCGMALAKATPHYPGSESAWHETVLERSLDVVSPSALDRFYTTYFICITQNDVSPLWQSWIVTDCLDRTIRTADPITDEPRTIAASVVGNTLFDPAANSDEGLAALPELPDTVAQLVTDDPTMFTTLLDDVQRRYADHDVSDIVVIDPDSTDFDAVGQRVLAWVRGRAMVHALADSETPRSVADDIHEAAVETAREASEPDVSLAGFYTVALVGLAAESDPEMASTHDELLDSALRRDTIDSCGFCIAYFKTLSDADSYLPDLAPNLDVFEWHLHLADSLLARATNGFDGLPDDPEETGEMIARMLAGIADAKYPADGPASGFHTLLDTVEDHDLDVAVTEHAIQRVPELLADEYTNVLAQLDWEERFDHIV